MNINSQDHQVIPKPSDKALSKSYHQALLSSTKPDQKSMLFHKGLSHCNRLLATLCFAMSCAPLANATDYYVDTKGSDSNPGSLAAPWRTITNAANKLVAGDAVYIRAGIYREQITPKYSGNAINGVITYAAYPGEMVTLDASGGLNWNWNGVFDLSNKSYLQVSGLRMINSPGFGIFMSASTNIHLLNNHTYNTAYSGIYAENSDTIAIDGNEVELANKAVNQESISLDATKNFIVSNNRVHGGSTEGIDAKAGSSNGRIFGNSVYDMARVGIYVDAWDSIASHIEIYNNIVFNSSPVVSGSAVGGIRVGGEHGGTAKAINIYNNLLYNIAGTGIELSDWHEAEYGEPIFSNISIYNNTTHNCGTRDAEYGGGIDILGTSATGIVIQNNILSQNRYFPIRLSTALASAYVQISNNLIDRSSFKQDAPATDGVNAVIGSPVFMDAANNNFHLQAISPAINAGVASSQPMMDFDLKARSQSGPVDIGAFEYVSAATLPTLTPPSLPEPTVGFASTTVSITSAYTGKITASTATVKWTTNIPATGTVYYGINANNLNLSTTLGMLSSDHAVDLTGLARRTTYYYKITANSSNGGASSAVSSFRTSRGDKKI